MLANIIFISSTTPEVHTLEECWLMLDSKVNLPTFISCFGNPPNVIPPLVHNQQVFMVILKLHWCYGTINDGRNEVKQTRTHTKKNFSMHQHATQVTRQKVFGWGMKLLQKYWTAITIATQSMCRCLYGTVMKWKQTGRKSKKEVYFHDVNLAKNDNADYNRKKYRVQWYVRNLTTLQKQRVQSTCSGHVRKVPTITLYLWKHKAGNITLWKTSQCTYIIT